MMHAKRPGLDCGDRDLGAVDHGLDGEGDIEMEETTKEDTDPCLEVLPANESRVLFPSIRELTLSDRIVMSLTGLLVLSAGVVLTVLGVLAGWIVGYFVALIVFGIVSLFSACCQKYKHDIEDVGERRDISCPKCRVLGSMELYRQKINSRLHRKFHCRSCGETGPASALDLHDVQLGRHAFQVSREDARLIYESAMEQNKKQTTVTNQSEMVTIVVGQYSLRVSKRHEEKIAKTLLERQHRDQMMQTSNPREVV